MTLSTDLAKVKHHLTLTSASYVAAIMLPQLVKHNIKVFHFNRHYEDGSCIRLSTDAKWNEHFFTQGYINKRKKVPQEYLGNQINHFIWLTKDWPEMLTDAAINFDIANGISIAQKCDGYIDNFCFGSTVSNTSIINFYLNNLELLQCFCMDFKDRASTLIDSFEQDKIIIPIQTILQSTESKVSSEPLKFTQREKHCAMLLMSGKRIKEIATLLELSPRTVETHVNNLKIKLNSRDKIELIIKLREYFTL